MEFYAVYKVYNTGREKLFDTFTNYKKAQKYALEEKAFDAASHQTLCFEIRDSEGFTLWDTNGYEYKRS